MAKDGRRRNSGYVFRRRDGCVQQLTQDREPDTEEQAENDSKSQVANRLGTDGVLVTTALSMMRAVTEDSVLLSGMLELMASSLNASA